MNIWKSANKKSKKVTVVQEDIWSDEAGAVLPDIVSGLSFGASDTMIGQTTHCSDTERRRRRTNQPTTPVGLGAGPPMPLQDLGVIPAPLVPTLLRRQDMSNAWPQSTVQTVDNNWNQTPFPVGSPSDNHDNKTNSTWDAEGSRIRSMSNDAHCLSSDCHTNRRNRCSSATRNRQNRPKKTDPTFQNQNHLVVSPNPSSSPQTRRGFMTINREGRPRELFSPDNNCSSMSSSNLPIPGSSYGYQVSNLEALLTEATPTSPANLPMVLASSTRLHNTRVAQESQDASVWPFLPLGIIVNAVFKMRDWLYIRTAHGAEGYVPYGVCLPLGILPPSHVSHHQLGLNSPWDLRGPLDSTDVLRHPKPNNPSENLERGRSRFRRRGPLQSTNQTDLQKLQPPLFDNRPTRETLDPPTITDGPAHLV